MPATLPLVRIDVDHDEHLTVSTDGQAWAPPILGSDEPEVRLGRTDLPWVLEHVLAELDVPLRVELHDGGQTITEFLVPERFKAGNPSYSKAPPGYAPDRRRLPLPDYPEAATDGGSRRPIAAALTGGGYDAGEEVALAVVVTRLEADENGEIEFPLPPALHDRAKDLLTYGARSGLTLHYDTPHRRAALPDAAPPGPQRRPRRAADRGHGIGAP
jgi:hypothetical protein